MTDDPTRPSERSAAPCKVLLSCAHGSCGSRMRVRAPGRPLVSLTWCTDATQNCPMASDVTGSSTTESRIAQGAGGESLLLQIRSDRRLGHEWDDWDGQPLPNGGVFEARPSLFFGLSAALILLWGVGALFLLWLVAPRLDSLGWPLGQLLMGGVALAIVLGLLWLAAIWLVLRTHRNWLPEVLAERGLIPWLMPRVESVGRFLGLSRDRCGNAALRVYNQLMIARARPGLSPQQLLILLPRCLGKEAMQAAMSVSERYGVPMFVAARGRYARQMIAMRRPRAVVAVACERDLVSGVHDVARKLPVLGTTLTLGDGPCRNTSFEVAELEDQIRKMLGLSVGEAATSA